MELTVIMIPLTHMLIAKCRTHCLPVVTNKAPSVQAFADALK